MIFDKRCKGRAGELRAGEPPNTLPSAGRRVLMSMAMPRYVLTAEMMSAPASHRAERFDNVVTFGESFTMKRRREAFRHGWTRVRGGSGEVPKVMPRA